VTSLLDVQRAFARALMRDDAPEACAAVARDRIAPELRLAIHRDTFASTLTRRWSRSCGR
jgi:hypothetical protein